MNSGTVHPAMTSEVTHLDDLSTVDFHEVNQRSRLRDPSALVAISRSLKTALAKSESSDRRRRRRASDLGIVQCTLNQYLKFLVAMADYLKNRSRRVPDDVATVVRRIGRDPPEVWLGEFMQFVARFETSRVVV